MRPERRTADRERVWGLYVNGDLYAGFPSRRMAETAAMIARRKTGGDVKITVKRAKVQHGD